MVSLFFVVPTAVHFYNGAVALIKKYDMLPLWETVKNKTVIIGGAYQMRQPL